MNDTYKVYVLLDVENHITAINSSAFLTDLTGWTEIDSGDGDRFHHAQGNYLDRPVADMQGRYNYKLIDGVVTEIPDGDKPAIPDHSKLAEIAALKAQLAATDYKIIKCYEYDLVGEPLPYDIQTLHTERQSMRDQINVLEG